jgi:hypothetical protein
MVADTLLAYLNLRINLEKGALPNQGQSSSGGRDGGGAGNVTCVNVNVPGADKKGGAAVTCATRDRDRDSKGKPSASYEVFEEVEDTQADALRARRGAA